MPSNVRPDSEFHDKSGRQAPRYDVDVVITMREMGYQPFQARLRDVSDTGFLIETPETLGESCYIALTLPGIGEMNGRIVWRDATMAGGMFLTRIEAKRVVAAARAG
jgi:uncharacterized membrane protein YkgB